MDTKIDARRIGIFLAFSFGIAWIAVFAMTGQPNPLLGPLPVGIIGSLGFTLVAFTIFISPKALKA